MLLGCEVQEAESEDSAKVTTPLTCRIGGEGNKGKGDWTRFMHHIVWACLWKDVEG